jgi:hypothetical protein
MRPAARLAFILLGTALGARSASAQMIPAVRDTVVGVAETVGDTTIVSQRPRASRRSRFSGGGSLFYVQPRRDFARHVSGGVGFGLGGAWTADRDGVLGFRAEYQDVTYGYESVNDSSARNVIRSLDVGPQLTIPAGPVRPYVSAAVGVAYTGTEGSVPCYRNCSYDEDGDRLDESYSYLPRMTWSVARAAGLLVQMTEAKAGRTAWWLDLRVTRRHNGRTRYATRGADEVVYGNTDYRVYHVGVSAGLP